MLKPEHKLVLYMEGSLTGPAAKMGYGILRYSTSEVVAVIDSEHAGKETGEYGLSRNVPIVTTVDEAVALGAEVFVLGIAPLGGVIPDAWRSDIEQAVEKGLSVVNGLHSKLAADYPTLREGQWIWDIREEPEGLTNGLGWAMHMHARRVLMIGMDMAVGKMTAGLELQKEAQARGWRSKFIATGQIGMTVTGGGVPLDAVRLDFASGAIELEVVKAFHEEAELMIVEGQGALCHPSSSATLPLMRGSMPTHFVMCLRAGQTRVYGLETIDLPPIAPYIRLYEDLAEVCGTFPRPTTVGFCVNTSNLEEEEAKAFLANLEAEFELPAVDPVRFGGVSALLDRIMGSAAETSAD